MLGIFQGTQSSSAGVKPCNLLSDPNRDRPFQARDILPQAPGQRKNLRHSERAIRLLILGGLIPKTRGPEVTSGRTDSLQSRLPTFCICVRHRRVPLPELDLCERKFQLVVCLHGRLLADPCFHESQLASSKRERASHRRVWLFSFARDAGIFYNQ